MDQFVKTYLEHTPQARRHQSEADLALMSIILEILEASPGRMRMHKLYDVVCARFKGNIVPEFNGEFRRVLYEMDKHKLIEKGWTPAEGGWACMPRWGIRARI